MNSKILKAGILILMIVIPAFVFVFLEFFGENVYSLPYKFPVKASVQSENLWEADQLIPDFDNSVNLGNPKGDSLFLRFQLIRGLPENGAGIVFILKGPPDETIRVLIQRIANRIDGKRVFISNYGLSESKGKLLSEIMKKTKTQFEETTGFALLMDSENYFRGIYDPMNKDDAERLIVETEILLNN